MSQMPIETPTEESSLSSWNGRGDGGSHHAGGAQGSMFDEPAMTAGLEAYAAPEEQADTSSYDPSEDFSQESMEIDLDQVMEQEATSFEAQEFVESGTEQAVIQEPASEPAGELIAATKPVAEHPIEVSSPAPIQTQQAVIETTENPHDVAPSVVPVATETTSAPEPVTVLTADDFAALEDRILRAVTLVKREREARILAEGQVAALESQKQQLEAQSVQFDAQRKALEAQLREHQEQSPVLERLEREVDSLRAEREQVRQRVERLLGQLDALEL